MRVSSTQDIYAAMPTTADNTERLKFLLAKFNFFMRGFRDGVYTRNDLSDLVGDCYNCPLCRARTVEELQEAYENGVYTSDIKCEDCVCNEGRLPVSAACVDSPAYQLLVHPYAEYSDVILYDAMCQLRYVIRLKLKERK